MTDLLPLPKLTTPTSSQNHLLAALPPAEFEPLATHLELAPLLLGQMLYEPGSQLQYAYFPTTAIVSLHYVMASGATAESAGVGNEGVVGISLFMGGIPRRARPSCKPPVMPTASGAIC